MTAELAMIVATVACALACAALVRAELREDHAGRGRFKPIASLAFLATGVAAAVAAPSALAVCVVIGQLLGVGGDLALLRSRQPDRADAKLQFAIGVVLFLAGHVMFVVGFALTLSPLRWLRIAGWSVLVPTYVSVQTARDVRAHVTGTLRSLVPIYAAVITVMFAGALAVATYGGSAGGMKLVIGALAFYVSDVFVARDLVEDDVWNRVWGLPLYYGGQLLIAWSVAG
nr:lysoplasmalogenase [Kofleriaceae bacterium]